MPDLPEIEIRLRNLRRCEWNCRELKCAGEEVSVCVCICACVQCMCVCVYVCVCVCVCVCILWDILHTGSCYLLILHFLFSLDNFISTSCLIALARTSCIVLLTSSGESRHPCLVPDLKGNSEIVF